MLAVDISASMQALDFSTHYKRSAAWMQQRRWSENLSTEGQGDRVGLVTFGESAYLHVPLTLDTASVSRMLNDTVSGMAGNATAIGDAIGMSVRTLARASRRFPRAVLLTDGEDNSSSIPPLEAAKLAKQYGIRIYTIGIGKNGPGSVSDISLEAMEWAKSPMDEELLKEIAAMTGGQYFLATDKKVLESIYAKINELEKTESNEIDIFDSRALYYYPLSLCHGAFCFYFLCIS